ncbi:MAG: thioredoxin [Clostridia bacterium]|nr:thioredoxin [Clostridia bacterium]
MKKKIIIVISIVIFVLALTAINTFLNRQNETEIEGNDKQKTAKTEEKVIEVTSRNFEEEVIKSEKPVIIDFYATWCGPCKKLFPIVEETAKENENVKFVKIDIDNTEDIALEYQVKSIPTLLLIQNGEEKDRIVGIVDKNQILDFIEGK